MGKYLAAMFLAVSLPGIAHADERPEKDVRERIAGQFGGVDPSQIFAAPLQGFVEVRYGTNVVYVSRDGETMIRGDLIRLSNRENLTANRRAELRKEMLADLPFRDGILFRGKQVDTTITVFTDIDCGYCRKLHRGIGQLNEQGIAVRYLFYPRSGPGSPSWRKAERVWCAEDSQEALTRAKSGERIEPAGQCGQTPVKRHYRLGRAVGVSGTPAIVTESGRMIRGYMPPGRLVRKLRELESS